MHRARARRARLERLIRRQRSGFKSRFGGYWTDRDDAEQLLAAKVAKGEIGGADEERLRAWMRDGYVVLPRAVPAELVEAIDAEVDRIWTRADASYRIELGNRYQPLAPELRAEPCKLLDLYARFRPALEAALSEPIRRFLALVFEREPLLFQSLSFERGSRQAIHQDAAYVVLDSPMELAAAWIALEDVQKGSGELEYYVGSHRLPDFVFPGGARSFDAELHDAALHERYLAGLHERAQALGLVRERFRPKKGDALIWSADLAHGGSPVLDPKLTRKSLVCHYCPSDVRPYFFHHRAERTPIRRAAGGGAYCSSYYELG